MLFAFNAGLKTDILSLEISITTGGLFAANADQFFNDEGLVGKFAMFFLKGPTDRVDINIMELWKGGLDVVHIVGC
jgi:hypothetical protein